jgi:hypothetical protein
MPVLQPSPLPALAFSANTISCILQSDDYLASAGSVAVNALQLNGPITENAGILLKWNSVSLQLTAKNVPDDSAEQIPVGGGDPNHVAAIVQVLQANYLLAEDFTVSSNGNQVIFTAIQPGAGYNIDANTTGNLQMLRITQGVDRAVKPNFAHHIQLWVRPLSEPQFVQAWSYNIELDYPLTGKSDTDLGPEMLHNFLQPDLPSLNSQGIAPCLKSAAEYYIKYGQYFGSTPTVKRLYQSDNHRVIMGGLSLQAASVRDIFSELQPDPYDETKNRCLRQGSTAKIVTKEQPEWLYYINLKNAARNITAEVTIINTDGSTATFSTAGTLAVDTYGKIQLPAGFEQLQISTRQPVDKVPKYYNVRLRDDTGYITTIYTYVIDYNFHDWSRYFVYLNAYGAFQTLATTGKGQLSATRKKDDARLDKPAVRVATEGEFIEYNVTHQESGSVSIGYDRATPRTTRLLRDFFDSPTKFIYTNGRLIPIGISTSEVKEAPDGTDLFAGSFAYYHLMEEERYTEEPGQPDDDLYELLQSAGYPVPTLQPGTGTGSGNLTGIIDEGEDYDNNLTDLGE